MPTGPGGGGGGRWLSVGQVLLILGRGCLVDSFVIRLSFPHECDDCVCFPWCLTRREKWRQLVRIGDDIQSVIVIVYCCIHFIFQSLTTIASRPLPPFRFYQILVVFVNFVQLLTSPPPSVRSSRRRTPRGCRRPSASHPENHRLRPGARDQPDHAHDAGGHLRLDGARGHRVQHVQQGRRRVELRRGVVGAADGRDAIPRHRRAGRGLRRGLAQAEPARALHVSGRLAGTDAL